MLYFLIFFLFFFYIVFQIISQYLDPENIQVSTDDLLSALIVGRNILSTQANTSIHVNILERIVTNQQQNSNFLLFDWFVYLIYVSYYNYYLFQFIIIILL